MPLLTGKRIAPMHWRCVGTHMSAMCMSLRVSLLHTVQCNQSSMLRFRTMLLSLELASKVQMLSSSPAE